MTENQFQKQVLQKLDKLEKDVSGLKTGQTDLKAEVRANKEEILTEVRENKEEILAEVRGNKEEFLAELRLHGEYQNQGFDRLSDQMRETIDLKERVVVLERRAAVSP